MLNTIDPRIIFKVCTFLLLRLYKQYMLAAFVPQIVIRLYKQYMLAADLVPQMVIAHSFSKFREVLQKLSYVSAKKTLFSISKFAKNGSIKLIAVLKAVS